MFGTSFYGLVDKDYRRLYKNNSRKISKSDINDFLHKNCAYSGPLSSQSDAPECSAPHVSSGRRTSRSAGAPSPSDRITFQAARRTASTSCSAPPDPRPRAFQTPGDDPTSRGRSALSGSRSRLHSNRVHEESEEEVDSPPFRPSPPSPTPPILIDDDDLEFDPYGSNVGEDLTNLGADDARPSPAIPEVSSESPLTSSPEAGDDAVVQSDEDLPSRIPSTSGEPPMEMAHLNLEVPHGIGTSTKDDSIILLSDSSDDEGARSPVPVSIPRILSDGECLVEQDLDIVSGSGSDFFFNAAGEAPAPGEVVKYEPGGDYFHHMAYKRLMVEKEKQDIMDQLEASRRKQAEMEATVEKQRMEFALEKEQIAATIRAELQLQMKADLALMLAQHGQTPEAASSRRAQSELPASSSYPRIEDNSGSGHPAFSSPAALVQNSSSVPGLDPSSADHIQSAPCGLPVPAGLPDVPSSSSRSPVEYPRPEDTTLGCRLLSPAKCSVTIVPFHDQMDRGQGAASVPEVSPRPSAPPPRQSAEFDSGTCRVDVRVVDEDVSVVEEDRVDYELTPEGAGPGSSDEDKVG
jgi:hypothetical protein